MTRESPTNTGTVQVASSVTAALRRLTQLVHMNAWKLWTTMRLTPTQQNILQVLYVPSAEIPGAAERYVVLLKADLRLIA